MGTIRAAGVAVAAAGVLLSGAPALVGPAVQAAPAEVSFQGSSQLLMTPNPSQPSLRLRSTTSRFTARPRSRVAPLPAPAPTETTAPAPAPAPAPVPAPAPAPVSTSTAFRFSAVEQGEPVRWDPCTTLQWVFSSTNAPAGGLALAQAAMSNLAQVTGIPISYAGTTSTVPTRAWTSNRSGPQIIIGWTSGAESDLLAGLASGVAGVTRWQWWGMPRGDGYVAVLGKAAIALDRSDSLPMTGRISWRGVLKHELGHAAGLGHINDTSQLMNPTLTREDFAAGDTAGLVRLGRSAGCLS